MRFLLFLFMRALIMITTNAKLVSLLSENPIPWFRIFGETCVQLWLQYYIWYNHFLLYFSRIYISHLDSSGRALRYWQPNNRLVFLKLMTEVLKKVRSCQYCFILYKFVLVLSFSNTTQNLYLSSVSMNTDNYSFT